jgi:hypothetical protein
LAKLPKAAIDTRKQSAAAAGVGERTYDAGKLILEAAEKGEIPQQTIDDLRNRKVAIHRVADAVREISRAEIVAKLEDVVKVKRLVADVDRPL